MFYVFKMEKYNLILQQMNIEYGSKIAKGWNN